jgi:sRNA-binding carbon storage regulator CsrA
MLILTRYPGDAFIIRPQVNLDPATLVSELFATEPVLVRITAVKGSQVRLGISAHAGLCVVREELKPLTNDKPLAADTRLALALKLRVLMYLRKHTSQSLAEASGLPLERVLMAEGGTGVEKLADLDKLAHALRVKTVELFRPPGRTPEERAILEMLDK